MDSLDVTTGLRRVVVRGGALAASGFLTSQAISFIGFVVLARLAPPATFGAYAAASILLGTSALFVDAGMQAAVIQRRERVQEAASTALAANLVGSLGLAALAASLAPVIGLFFHSGEIGRAAAVMAGTIPINAAAIVPGALLQRRVSYRFPFLEPLGSLAYGIAGIVALGGGLGLWGLVIATYVAAVVRTTAVWALSGWRPAMSLVSWSMWRSLSRYGRPVVFSALLREVGITGTTAIVGRALGTGALGRFRAAQRLVLQANSAIVYGSAYVLLPFFSRIWQDERRFQESILRALRTLTLIVFPLSLVFIPLGRPIATILLGERWRAAGPIMMAMAGVGVALALDSVSSEAFKAVGRTDLLPRMHGLTAILPIGLMFPLLQFGAVGAGLALSLGMSIVALYAIRALGKVARLPLRIILAQLRPASSCAVLMAAGVYVLDRYAVHAAHRIGLVGVCLLILDLIAAAILYLGLLLMLSRRSVVELKDAAKLLVGRVEGSASTTAL